MERRKMCAVTAAHAAKTQTMSTNQTLWLRDLDERTPRTSRRLSRRAFLVEGGEDQVADELAELASMAT
jgi:hypothetical protein